MPRGDWYCSRCRHAGAQSLPLRPAPPPPAAAQHDQRQQGGGWGQGQGAWRQLGNVAPLRRGW